MPDSGVKISSLPSAAAEDIQGTDVLAGVSDDETKKFSFSSILTWIKARLSKSDVGLDNVANVLQYSASNPPPTPTKSDIGLGNVDNEQQYSASNPPPYPVTSVNGQTGNVSITIPIPASPSDASPAMDGTANAGSSSDYARGDHVHPTDTTRQATITATGVLVGDGSGGVSAKPVDSVPINNSQNLISSAAVAGALGTLSDAVAIVVDGNQSALGAAVGQYVIVRNSTITGVTDGLYTAATAIPANTAIDATYLTAVSGGGLNDLNAALQSLPKFTTFDLTINTDPGYSFYIPSNYRGLMVLIAAGTPEAHGLITVSCTSGNTVRYFKLNGAGYTISTGYHALTVEASSNVRILFITYSDTIAPYLITQN